MFRGVFLPLRVPHGKEGLEAFGSTPRVVEEAVNRPGHKQAGEVEKAAH